MRKLYAAFVCVNVEQPFIYRLSEESIKQEFPDGTIETENFLLLKDGYYSKFFGTSGAPLDTPFVYSSDVMVYYSLEEENVIQFLKERRKDMESFANLLSKRLKESEITFARMKDEYSTKQYQN